MVDLQQQPEPLRQMLIQKKADHFSLGRSLLMRVIVPWLRRPAKFALDSAGIPTIFVENQTELEALVDDIKNACLRSPIKIRMVLRGQTSEYQLPDRSQLAIAGVCPFSDVRDHSFVPSFYRRYDDFLDEMNTFREFLLQMQDWSLYSDLVFGDPAQYLAMNGTPYVPKELNSPCTVKASYIFSGGPTANRALEDMGPYTRYEVIDSEGNLLDEYIKQHRPGYDTVRRNLVLQHYGAPTPYIDVTDGIRIAEWFALNTLTINADGLSTIGTLKAPFRKSAIFVFLVLQDLAPIVDTVALVDTNKSLRPHRQECALLGGAGNLYRNAASRFLGLKIKLADGFIPVGLPTAAWLFPGPDEDNALKDLLSRYRLAANDKNLFPVYWLPNNPQ
jgi:hypothetical protein